MPLPRLLARLLARIADSVLARLPPDDPWERLAMRVRPRDFGHGSQHDFRWYFEGESRVPVASLAEVCDWLVECEYVRDPDLFHERDFWQHPSTFERIRKGDCEDHALWAWRKLVELGYDAELVCGEWDVTRDGAGGHAWVLFRDGGREYVLESVARTTETMVRPLEEVRACYCPHVAVNAKFETSGFSGVAASSRRRRARRRAGLPESPAKPRTSPTADPHSPRSAERRR